MNLKNVSTHLFSFSRVLVLDYLFLSPWNDVCVHPIKSCCSPWQVLKKLQVARLVARNPGKHLVGAVILRTHFGFCHLALLSVLARVPSRSISWVGLLCAEFPAPCRLSYVHHGLLRVEGPKILMVELQLVREYLESVQLYFSWHSSSFVSLGRSKVPAKAKHAFLWPCYTRCALWALQFSSRLRTVGVDISLLGSSGSNSAFWVLTLFFLSIDFCYRCCCFSFLAQFVSSPLPSACAALACVID